LFIMLSVGSTSVVPVEGVEVGAGVEVGSGVEVGVGVAVGTEVDAAAGVAAAALGDPPTGAIGTTTAMPSAIAMA
jgi:hypothetical protein